MDSTVPAGAAILLDFIGETEAPQGYETIYGNNQDRLKTPITHRTLDALIKAQSDFTRRYGSSASGRYQFMRATLKDLKAQLGLTGAEVFTPDMQDRLAYVLLKRRGYADFMAGRISGQEFAKRLAMEWASFPVLAPCRGAHRQLQRGQSYYAGDKLNRALVSPEKVEAVLARVKAPQKPAQTHKEPETAPSPSEGQNGSPAPAHGGMGSMIALALAGLAALLAGFWQSIVHFFGGIF